MKWELQRTIRSSPNLLSSSEMPSSLARQRIESCLPSTIPNFVLRADSFKDRKDSFESRDINWDRITTGLKAAWLTVIGIRLPCDPLTCLCCTSSFANSACIWAWTNLSLPSYLLKLLHLTVPLTTRTTGVEGGCPLIKQRTHRS